MTVKLPDASDGCSASCSEVQSHLTCNDTVSKRYYGWRCYFGIFVTWTCRDGQYKRRVQFSTLTHDHDVITTNGMLCMHHALVECHSVKHWCRKFHGLHWHAG